ncbi:MAG: hypothetical protein HN348_12075, partial [Proteobacteria bacterium]|nr:hypothetical protein [Pseudomonadota bacterium]
MSEILESGGTLAIVVLGLGGLGLLITLVFAGLAFSKKRVPLTAWVAIPLLVMAVGALGSWMASGTVLGEIPDEVPDQIANHAFNGLWASLTTDWLARWVAAGLFACMTWAAAIGSAVSPGPERLWTLGAAVMSGAFTIIGTIACAVYAFRHEMAPEAYALAGLLAFGGFGVTLGATRRAIEEHQFRVAGMRFAACCCLVFSLAFAGSALGMGNRMYVFGPGGFAVDNTIGLQVIIDKWALLAAPVASLGWIVLGFAFVIAMFGVMAELGEVVMRYTLLDVVATIVLFGVLTGAHLVKLTNTSKLASFGTYGPAPIVFQEVGSDLPSALIQIKKKTYEVAPRTGGFDDVYVYETKSELIPGETPDDPPTTRKWQVWTRKFVRQADGWIEDATPAEKINKIDGLPLIAIGGSFEGVFLVDLMSKVTNGEALMLMGASEVKGDTEVPVNIAHRQVTFMPISMKKERDLSKELFSEAGARNRYYNGPILWYHEDMDEESMTYIDSAFEDTKSPGLHVLVGTRTRTKGIAASCLGVVMKNTVEDLSQPANLVPTDRWCSLVKAERQEFIEEAAKIVPK